MRPDRFEGLLVAAINQDGRLTARTYRDADVDRSRFGIVATTSTGTPVNVQIAVTLAANERDEHPAPPVLGDPHPDLPIPDPVEGGKLDLARLEQYLAGLAIAATPREIASIRQYQDRETPGAVRYGATITYNNTAVIYLYVLTAGSNRHSDFAPPATA
ncbi:hypothetical protein ACIHCX_03640 [Streptomyces sp. NPDC052043]|uniref:hypothetical protein n=1 Tax=Streptomyces sp. NPDC052043 TaxID=3365684 RepID=UPI0037CE59A7